MNEPKNTMKPVTIAQSNALTNARYSFTLYQKRFLYYIIKEVRRLYVESNNGNRTLFGNMYLTITPEQLKECGKTSQVFREAAELREKTIYINRGVEEVAVGWINYVKRNKKSGIYEVEVSKEIMPEIVELAEKFHTYELTVALSLKSVYSQRIYEICSQYKNYQNGYFFFEIETLHKMFKLPKSYLDFNLLKERVLNVAQRELKELYDKDECDLYFNYRVKDKKGKKVISIEFSVITRERESEKQYSLDDAIFFVRTYIAPIFKRDKRFIDRIVQFIRLNPSFSAMLVGKITEKINKYPIKDQPAIIRYVLSEDFGIK